MTNKTFYKYLNMYTVNRYRNEIFDHWLKKNYDIIEGSSYSYGETFIDRATGERVMNEAQIMMRYVRIEKLPHFKDPVHLDMWLNSNYKNVQQFFASTSY